MQTEFASLRAGERLDLTDPAAPLARARHVAVLDAAGRVVGIASLRDLLEGALRSASTSELPERRRALRAAAWADVTRHPVETIDADASVGVAADRMLGSRFGCLPVVTHDGVMVGLLTEADLLAAAVGLRRPPTGIG